MCQEFGELFLSAIQYDCDDATQMHEFVVFKSTKTKVTVMKPNRTTESRSTKFTWKLLRNDSQILRFALFSVLVNTEAANSS